MIYLGSIPLAGTGSIDDIEQEIEDKIEENRATLVTMSATAPTPVTDYEENDIWFVIEGSNSSNSNSQS